MSAASLELLQPLFTILLVLAALESADKLVLKVVPLQLHGAEALWSDVAASHPPPLASR